MGKFGHLLAVKQLLTFIEAQLLYALLRFCEQGGKQKCPRT
jgi:hypothetical protein